MSGVPPAGDVAGGRPLRVLLVEDDDGDALIVEDLLEDSAAPVALTHVRTLAEARAVAAEQDCALLDLNLPDATGLDGLRLLREHADHLAILVLTGLDDEGRGIDALAAGAQDYLIKGHVDGNLLARSLRYAVERRRAEDSERALTLARMQASENARLERGLLPVPLLSDPAVDVATHYRAGRRRALLGGDFFDLVEDDAGALHAIIGDVCGHGPDEAALGVALRIAWRTLMVSGTDPDAVLPTLQRVLEAERHHDSVFTTLATVTLDPQRRALSLRSAGHPLPLLLDADGTPQELGELPSGPPLGIVAGAAWEPTEVALPERWTLLLFTDGVIEGRCGEGPERLGESGFGQIVAEARGRHGADLRAVVREVVERAEELNAGPLLDDVALLLIAFRGG